MEHLKTQDSPTLLGRAVMALSFKRRREPSSSIVSADQSTGSLQDRGRKIRHPLGFHSEEYPRGTCPTRSLRRGAEPALPCGVEGCADRRPWPSGWSWGRQGPWGAAGTAGNHTRAAQAWTPPRWSVWICCSSANKVTMQRYVWSLYVEEVRTADFSMREEDGPDKAELCGWARGEMEREKAAGWSLLAVSRAGRRDTQSRANPST